MCGAGTPARQSRRQHTVSSQLGTSPNLTLQIGLSRVAGTIQSPLQAEFRGCFQWVLDAACQAVEWLSQPLGFESLTLCSHSTTDFILTSRSTRISLNMTGGVQHFCFQPRMTTGAFVFLWAHVGPLVVLRQRSPWVLRRAKNAGLRMTTRYSRRRSGVSRVFRPEHSTYAPAAPWKLTSTSLRSSSETLNISRGFRLMKLATKTSGICPMRVL